jgi:hypothetical protein
VLRMIEPIFTAKLRYAMELVCDSTNFEADMSLRRLHKIHRAAMKAALGIETREHPDDDLLLKRTGQSSVHEMALRAPAGLAWRCAQSWQNHPLTGGRIEEQQPKKATRQASSREFPPQSEKTLLVSRLVETWVKIPDHIKKEERESVAKKKIKSWVKFS